MSKIRKVLPFFISDAFGWLNNMPDAQVPKLVTLQRIAISCYQETKSVVTKKQNIFFVFFRQKDAKRCDLDESILSHDPYDVGHIKRLSATKDCFKA